VITKLMRLFTEVFQRFIIWLEARLRPNIGFTFKHDIWG